MPKELKELFPKPYCIENNCLCMKQYVKALSEEKIILRDKAQYTQSVHVGDRTIRLLVSPITSFKEIAETAG